MILIQNSQSIDFDRVLASISENNETLVVDDELMGESLSTNKKKISGITLFELTDNAIKTAELSRNERFCDPTIPIAYIGVESTDKPIPLGCRLFDSENVSGINHYLSEKVKMRVLLVEDDEGICEFLNTTLSKHYVVDIARDGIEGKERIKNTEYDAIVLDVMLPGISGEELFQLAKSHRPGTAIVVITAYDTQEREFAFKFDDVDAYLKKPFDSNRDFRIALIEAILKKHKSVNARLSKSVQKKISDDKDDYMNRMSSYL